MSQEQIDSSVPKPAVPEDKTAALPAWSSMSLVSVHLHELMEEIILAGNVPKTFEVEDNTYLTNALNMAKIGKKFDMLDQLEQTIFHFRKASKIID